MLGLITVMHNRLHTAQTAVAASHHLKAFITD
jgi:hypothetical protein